MTYPVPFTEEELELIADGWRIANDEGSKYEHLFASHVDIETHNPCKGVNIVGILKDGNMESTLAAFSWGRTLVCLALGIIHNSQSATVEEDELALFDLFVSRVRGK